MGQNGTGNSSGVVQAGAFSDAYVLQTGASNTSLIFQYGTGTLQTDANIASVTQSGAGSHNSLVIQAGKHNIASISQTN